MKAKIENGILRLHGREYWTVARRLADFRASHDIGEGWGILTSIIAADADRVLVRAAIVDPSGREVATGYAEELRSNRGINANSALENCETSAVGRALAAAGYVGSGYQYASADEVIAARQQPEQRRQPEQRGAGPDQWPASRAAAQIQTGPAGVPVPSDFSDGKHPSWSGEQAKFCAALGDLGVKYADLADWLSLIHGMPRPSQISTPDRRALYRWIKSGGGAEHISAEPMIAKIAGLRLDQKRARA